MCKTLVYVCVYFITIYIWQCSPFNFEFFLSNLFLHQMPLFFTLDIYLDY